MGMTIYMHVYPCKTLELVNDMTIEEFLLALRRFIARRGKPVVIFSDNTTTFKAAAKTTRYIIE